MNTFAPGIGLFFSSMTFPVILVCEKSSEETTKASKVKIDFMVGVF
jgi:hypothetical protein